MATAGAEQADRVGPSQLFRRRRGRAVRWIERLKTEAKVEFPEKVTAFRKEMAVHGRYGQPCPRCGQPIQRIRYADNETNYCARCQTEGRVLADRTLSRLLGKDWPRTLDELESMTETRARRSRADGGIYYDEAQTLSV